MRPFHQTNVTTPAQNRIHCPISLSKLHKSKCKFRSLRWEGNLLEMPHFFCLSVKHAEAGWHCLSAPVQEAAIRRRLHRAVKIGDQLNDWAQIHHLSRHIDRHPTLLTTWDVEQNTVQCTYLGVLLVPWNDLSIRKCFSRCRSNSNYAKLMGTLLTKLHTTSRARRKMVILCVLAQPSTILRATFTCSQK